MINYRQLRDLAGEARPSRLLAAWLENENPALVERLFDGAGIDRAAFAATLAKETEEPLSAGPLGDEDKNLIRRAVHRSHQTRTQASDLLAALCETPGHPLRRSLRAAGLDCNRLVRNCDQLARETAGLAQPAAGTGARAAPPRRPATRTGQGPMTVRPTPIPAGSYLEQLGGRNLTALAGAGAFAELAPRPEELEQLVRTLLRKRKSNVIITGPAGVGKTALVEGLARGVINGEIPDLTGQQILEIGVAKLIAGTKYRGELEERFERLLDEFGQDVGAILFVDEVHQLLGAGRSEGGHLDGANMLKPYLARDNFRMIGATTTEEYHRIVLGDKALARRFEELALSEPAGTVLEAILAKHAAILTRHHGVAIDDAAIALAIALTDQHVRDRMQPDKSIDLLDNVAVGARREGRTTLDRPMILAALARMRGLPISDLQADDRTRLSELAENLRRRVVGQNQAIDRIASLLINRRMGLGDSERPLATLLLAGPTGVGKSETAKAIAAEFFGDPGRLIRIDLGEFTDPSAINKLLGAPPGFIGSGQDSALVRGLHQHPAAVVLLDEVEKAHADLLKPLLALLDVGRVTSARGETLDARQCVFVLTTNALVDPERGSAAAQLGRTFPQEFLGRIDEIMLYRPLDDAAMRSILGLRLDEALERIAGGGVTLRMEREHLLDHLLTDARRDRFGGARSLARIVDARLIEPLAAILLQRDERPLEITLDETFYES